MASTSVIASLMSSSASSSHLELGSIVVSSEDQAYLLAIAALAPNLSAIEFFAKLKLGLGQSRAERVAAYFAAHPEVLKVRDGEAPGRKKLRLLDIDGHEISRDT